MPPVEYVDEQGQLSFSGLNLDGVTRGSNLQLDGEMENLVIDSGGTAVTVDSLYLVSDSNRINQVLWEGEFDSGIESLNIVDTLAGAAGAMEFTDLRAFGSTELDPPGERGSSSSGLFALRAAETRAVRVRAVGGVVFGALEVPSDAVERYRL